MSGQPQPDKQDPTPGEDTRDWLPGALIPLAYLALIGCGVWLIGWRPDLFNDPRVQIAVWVVVVVALVVAALLFVQQWKSGIYTDRRNWMDFSRFQWRKRIAQDWDETDRR